jgi:D-glycero-D-manno-heptose 1,7-bisphosphate phosphatase
MNGALARALFLDRDGVINVERGYVHRPEEFTLMPGSVELMRHFQTAGFLLIVATNQSGIARGLYSEEDFTSFSRWVDAQLAEQGVAITRTYYCPFHPEAPVARYRRDSADRKPQPGLLLRAQAEFNLAMADSWLVGDKESDIGAGKNAGVGHTVLLTPAPAPAPTEVVAAAASASALPLYTRADHVVAHLADIIALHRRVGQV